MTGTFALPGAFARSEGGASYRVWAPDRARVGAAVFHPSDLQSPARLVDLDKGANGFFTGHDPAGRAGDLYKFQLDGDAGQTFPDPASRFQPHGVHGPSEVTATEAGRAFPWRHDAHWKRFSRPDLVIYELHVGTFTPEGTFRAAIGKLGELAALGVNAIELMPLADFPGRWNWGYDGVCLYAPARCYGRPDDLRALVDAAHGHGLSVILDAVYNHLGPDGNYLSCYGKGYFNARHKTPWGDALNFDGPDAAPVREFFIGNVVYWLEEFHFDGFRLDAVHAILDDSPRHVLSEIAAAIHARGGFVIAEDERNAASLATPEAQGGTGLDGLWADDFHHSVRVALTGDRDSYFGNYEGTPEELRDTLTHGWHYRGQPTPTEGKPRGSECAGLPPGAFVHCISNHDQVGNRAFGERLTVATTPAAYRAASALLCLSPYTPLLFMGQEWAASTPFLFFTDHNEELGKLVTAGRRREFKGFAAFSDESSIQKIPDPQAESTFQASKLLWTEATEGEHAKTRALYRAALRLRREDPALRRRGRGDWEVLTLGPGVSGILHRGGGGEGGATLVVFALAAGQLGNLATAPGLASGGNWRLVFSSEDTTFGGSGARAFNAAGGGFRFDVPETLVLKAANQAELL